MCVFKAKKMCTVCVIALEKIILLLVIVRSQKCYIEINFNPCSCTNKESMKDVVASQSTMAIMLNKVSLLAIV